jgi:hypothetical protein
VENKGAQTGHQVVWAAKFGTVVPNISGGSQLFEKNLCMCGIKHSFFYAVSSFKKDKNNKQTKITGKYGKVI